MGVFVLWFFFSWFSPSPPPTCFLTVWCFSIDLLGWEFGLCSFKSLQPFFLFWKTKPWLIKCWLGGFLCDYSPWWILCHLTFYKSGFVFLFNLKKELFSVNQRLWETQTANINSMNFLLNGELKHSLFE